MRVSKSFLSCALNAILIAQFPFVAFSNVLKFGENGCTATIGDKIEDNTKHRRLVSTNFNEECEESATIEVLFTHDNVMRSFERVEAKHRRSKIEADKSATYSSWIGEDKDGSSLHFVQDNDGHMAGSIVDLKTHNVIQIHTKNGEAEAIVTPSKDFFPEGHPITENLRRLKETKVFQDEDAPPEYVSKEKPKSTIRSETNASSESSRKLYDDLGGNLDIMVIWTAKAACAAYGEPEGCEITDDVTANMQTLVNLAISETNVAYSTSGIETELLLVHSYQHPTYVETSFEQTIDDMNTGVMPGVHDERKIHGADIVSILVDMDEQICGLAYVGPEISIMYSATQQACATGIYSFGHEVGHNLGLLHDRGNENACGVEGFNYGYRDPEARLRTIMGTDCVSTECDNNAGGGCDRIARYSNPNFQFTGISLGNAGTEDAAQTININRIEIAAYYEHGIFITDAPSSTPTLSQNPTAAPCESGETDVEVRFTSDDYPKENSWIIEYRGEIYASGENFTEKRKKYISENCLDGNICFNFKFRDSFGDGLFRLANFDLVVDGVSTLRYDQNTEKRGFTELSTEFGFCTDSPTTSPPTTNPTSLPSLIPSLNNSTKTPSEFPSATFSPTQLPTYSSTDWCVDSKLRFRFRKWYKWIRRDCEWVARKNSKNRCKMPKISTMCPQACNTCVPCTDGGLRFRFRWNKKMITRSCDWVSRRATKYRCKIPGVKEICRSTCGVC